MDDTFFDHRKMFVHNIGELDKTIITVIPKALLDCINVLNRRDFLENYQKLERILTCDYDVCHQKCHAIEGRSTCFWMSTRKSRQSANIYPHQQ